jgi:phenylpyruvate tautomerase PptA (4-oxalocrotonate tautomerase family)
MFFLRKKQRKRERERREAKSTSSPFITVLKTDPSKIALIISEILRKNLYS